MKIKTARGIANTLIDDLTPHCKRISIAGSVRRGNMHDINNLKFVAIPKMKYQPDISMKMMPSSVNLLFDHVRKQYDVTTGGKNGQKMVRFNVCENIPVELYMATDSTWGYILTLRTGPAELSKALVIKLKQKGYTPEGGKILDGGRTVSVPREETVFRMAGMRYRSPAVR